jgi:DNA ligase 1
VRAFAQLYAELDASTSTLDKVAALRGYFARSDVADSAWGAYFLCGGKPKQLVPTALLRALAVEAAGISEWLFEESYQAVGDLAETIALVVPEATEPTQDDASLSHWVEQRLLPMGAWKGDEALAAKREAVLNAWARLDAAGRFVYVKLIGGGFRVGVSKLLVQRAIAEHFGIDAKLVAERMMGYANALKAPSDWPNASKFIAISQASTPAIGLENLQSGQPYPFFLAHALEPAVGADAQRLHADLGAAGQWQVEWKFDGIRAQIVRRGEAGVWIWSRGEELITERFPEVAALALRWPAGTVLDGELLAWKPGSDKPQAFAQLQQRITRKSVSKKLLADVPVQFVAYDVLEHRGCDLRERPQHERRAVLESLAAQLETLALSPIVGASDGATSDWSQLQSLRQESRARGVEGFMLKHRESAYGVGRRKAAGGGWWKWKVDPMSIDCVLVYAQAGHGRRASIYTDYTFAVWSRPPNDDAEVQAVLQAIANREPPQPGALQLVAFAKAYSGLTDEEFKRVDAVIRKSTVEKFGPVRSVVPSLVFELGFEGIAESPRHKSGIAVRFPRMLRIRDDKPLHEANHLGDLRLLLNQ